jgi:hypothetical protein
MGPVLGIERKAVGKFRAQPRIVVLRRRKHAGIGFEKDIDGDDARR